MQHPPPYHHYPQPPQPPQRGMSPGTIAVLAIIAVIAFFVIIGAVGGRKGREAGGDSVAPSMTTATGTTTTMAKAAPAKTYERVSAAQLIHDYDGNEIRGDQRWKNASVEVTGVVESIDKGPFGGLYVVLGTGEQMQFHTVHVNLKKSEESRAAALDKGQRATFRGTVQGYVIGSVSVRDAELL